MKFLWSWKKWAAYRRGDELAKGHSSIPQKSVSPLSSISVKAFHLKGTTPIELTILQSKPSGRSPKQHDDRRILRRNTSFSLDTFSSPQGSLESSQSPIRDKLPRLSPQLPYSSTDHLRKLIPSCTLSPKDGVEKSVPYQKYFPLLQPLEVSDDLCPGSTRPYNSANRASSTDNISCSSDEIQHPQKKFDHSVLDLWVDAKPRTLNHRTRSMPYLPYESDTNSTPASSVSLVNASEGNFPLSLFPTPPVYMARKRIPPPLVLRNSPTTSLQSSCDSTPVGTPTTPRFSIRNSPSQSNFSSCKRPHSSRRITSPPPFSPPNSPLPSPPVCHENNGRLLEYTGRPRLRTAYSSSNLKDTLPLSGTHRLTFSESIHSSLPIKKSRNPRPEGTQRLRACLVSRFLPASNVTSICSPSRIRRRENKCPQLSSKIMYNGVTRFRTCSSFRIFD
jgi:hypothetical protein